MGWEPITYCRECDEPFDVYAPPGMRVCESCAEATAYFGPWQCPINYPGCITNCGNYGCGNIQRCDHAMS